MHSPSRLPEVPNLHVPEAKSLHVFFLDLGSFWACLVTGSAAFCWLAGVSLVTLESSIIIMGWTVCSGAIIVGGGAPGKAALLSGFLEPVAI